MKVGLIGQLDSLSPHKKMENVSEMDPPSDQTFLIGTCGAPILCWSLRRVLVLYIVICAIFIFNYLGVFDC